MRLEQLMETTEVTNAATLAEWATGSNKIESRASLRREAFASQKALHDFGYAVLSTFNMLDDGHASRAIVLQPPAKTLDEPNFKVAKLLKQHAQADDSPAVDTFFAVQVFEAAPVSNELLEEGLEIPEGAEVVGPGTGCVNIHTPHDIFVGFKQTEERWDANLDYEGSPLLAEVITRQALDGYFKPRSETVDMLVAALCDSEMNPFADSADQLSAVYTASPLPKYILG